METRARDLARAEQLRRARTDLVLAASERPLGQILSVTGEKDLLALSHSFAVPILAPAAFRDRMQPKAKK